VSDKIIIDREVFTALSSDTRIEILKELDERRKTLSELAKKLGCNKSAVYKHLSKLTEAGLVKKEEQVHKWIYYSLTWKGKNILHPERTKLILLLSTAVASLVGALLSAYIYVKERASQSGPGVAQTHPPSYALYFSIIFLFISISFFLLSLFTWKRREKIEIQ